MPEKTASTFGNTAKLSKTLADGAVSTRHLLISNKPHAVSSSFPVHSPSTGKLLHQFGFTSLSDTELAISSAQTAFPAWCSLPPPKKHHGVRKEELINYCIEETGATLAWASFNLTLAVDIIRDVSGRISSIAGVIPATAQDGVSALLYKESYGVVLAIAPWNAPYILGVRSVVYPLAAGNTAILMAPELSPMCSHAIVSYFHDAGLPNGVLNLIAHKPSDAAAVTRYLIEHPSIKKVNFTGSTIVGKIIVKHAGENLKPVLLDLGGKAPAIVLDDADFELAAMECAVRSFLNSGQIFMSTERVIVLETVAEEFEAAFKKAAAHFAPEDQDSGCLINKGGVEKNKQLLQDAISKGATIVHGDPTNGVDAKMRPVIVKGTTKDMDLFDTESFWPTVSLIMVKCYDTCSQDLAYSWE